MIIKNIDEQHANLTFIADLNIEKASCNYIIKLHNKSTQQIHTSIFTSTHFEDACKKFKELEILFFKK